MNIFDRINEDEREQMVDYIEACAGFDASSLNLKASLEHILRFWSSNKVDLFRVFGGELILNKNISFTKPQDVIETDMSKLICYNGDGYEFYCSFDNWVRSTYRDGDLNTKYNLLALMYTEYLATNIYAGESFSIVTPDNHKLTISTGCKVSKMLGKIASSFNLAGYEKFRLAHSLFLNQKITKGELCLSIHPLDYMTMSDNACDWSSCMSWMGGGDYRQGTVEMMNSGCVVVAYLKASEDMETVCGHKWNNKKWRQLFIVTPHIIVGIRQYPYNSDELYGITLNWLRELAQKNGGWGPYEDTAVLVKNHVLFPVASLDRKIELDFSTHFMYNDFYAQHLAYIAPSIPDYYELCFSGESECMACGEDISRYEEGDMEASSLTCNDCENVIWCSECGERIDADRAIWVDGNRVCPYCYDNYYHDCAICGEVHNENYFATVYLRESKDQTYDQIPYCVSVCEDCLNSPKFIELFGHTDTIPYGRWNTRYVVDIENITIDGLDYFEIWDEEDYNRIENVILNRSNETVSVQASAEY